MPEDQNSTVQEIVRDIMASEPMKRVLEIESLAVFTGRAQGYYGILIDEVLTNALQKAYTAGMEAERERIKIETEVLVADYTVPFRQGGYRKYIRDIAVHALEKVLSLATNKEK